MPIDVLTAKMLASATAIRNSVAVLLASACVAWFAIPLS
jgi:hypothetical protein